jgi:hypothetical protein
MAKQEAQSYEVAEYSKPALDTATAFKVINQIFYEMTQGPAQYAVYGKMSGDQLRIHYHSYEISLPSKLRDVCFQAKEVHAETVKHLKKEFKARTGQALTLKPTSPEAEQFERNYTVEKVSLNERYYFKSWRFYEVSF